MRHIFVDASRTSESWSLYWRVTVFPPNAIAVSSHTRDGRRETGDERWETRETGNRKRKTRDRSLEKGGRQETGTPQPLKITGIPDIFLLRHPLTSHKKKIHNR